MNTFRKGIAAFALTAGAAMPAFATDPTSALFTAVDISSIASSISTLGVGVVGIALAMKGISLVKAAISKV